jgi:very-short-patch-repair endonuclease
MFIKYNHDLIEKAKELRENMTPEENKLWYKFLRNYPLRFLRQKVIDDYILDFYCSKVRLDIEIDGNQHLSVANREHDAVRAGKLSQFGITTIRFFNDQINLNFPEVCRQIESKINELLSQRTDLIK